MFAQCTSIKSIDLSNFTVKEETLTEGMFILCNSLMFIDLSNLYLKEKFDSLIKFNSPTPTEASFNVKYINLYNSLITEEDIYKFTNYSLTINLKEKIFFCFNDDISTDLSGYIDPKNDPMEIKNYISKCCDYDFENLKCNDDINYITVNFNNEFIYENGFNNSYRTSVKMVLLDNKEIEITERLEIKNNSELKIFFNDSLESLESFFNSKYDSNVKYIKSIDFSNLNTSKITDMSNLLYGCTSLEWVSFESITTPLVKSFNSMFTDCKSLKSLDLSYFDTSSAEDMGQMFERCQSLEYIDLSSFDTSSVTTMRNMFYKSNFDTSLVNNMMSMFDSCTELKILDISSFNMEVVDSRNVDNMFSNLLNLKYINIYNVKNTKDFIRQSYLKDIDNLTICQKEDIIISEKMLIIIAVTMTCNQINANIIILC